MFAVFAPCLVGPDINCSLIEIHEGESLEGQCTVTGNPSPSISWLKDGQPIDPTVTLSRENAGLYTIEAEGNINTSKTIRVFVLCECHIHYSHIQMSL